MNKTPFIIAAVAILFVALSRADEEKIDLADKKVNLGGSEEFTPEDLEQLKKNQEKHSFQTEVSKMMNIIIHSLYTNKEVFLRELISNASDALDKIRFLALTNPSLLGENDKLEIRIRYDEHDKTLTISDTGIGMTKEELSENLGTIAHSGTTEFLKASASGSGGDTSSLIGQFGVGFYSAFLVAERVTVISKSNNSTEQWIWESDASKSFTLSKDPRGNTLGRGTRTVLHLREDALDLMNANSLKSIVKKYSEFIEFPIYLWDSYEVEEEAEEKKEEESVEKKEDEEKKEESVEKKEEKKEEEKKESEEEKKEESVEKKEDEENKEEEKPKTSTTTFEEDEEAEEEKEKPAKVKRTEYGYVLLNTVKPLWTRNPKDITEEEYDSFFKAITKGTDRALLRSHFSAEGEVDFKALLFVPENVPSAAWDPNPNAHSQSLRLYVRRVLITGDFFDLLPSYLRFLRGVVDSDDFPLNVSREHLQNTGTLKNIKEKLVRKSISMISDYLHDNRTTYQNFFDKYGPFLKFGVVDDSSHREKLTSLLMFPSSNNLTNHTTFSEYVSRMKPNQKDIYYICGTDVESLSKSPVTERVIADGLEVLYGVHPTDEYAFNSIDKVEKKYRLVNLAKDGVKLKGIDSEKEKKANEEATKAANTMKSILGDRVIRVVVSSKLTNTPAALVAQSYGYTANMERIIRSQPTGNTIDIPEYMTKQVMEINPGHPIIADLAKKIEDTIDPEKDDNIVRTTKILYQTALVNSGYAVTNPHEFASAVYDLLGAKLGLDPEMKVNEVDLKSDKEDSESDDDDDEKEKKTEDNKEEIETNEDNEEKDEKDEKEEKEEKEEQKQEDKKEL